jgi:hypothetical protein
MAQKLIVLDEDKSLLIETDFTGDELEEVSEKIQAQFDEIVEPEFILKEMEKKNYLKIIGPGPEVINMYF